LWRWQGDKDLDRSGMNPGMNGGGQVRRMARIIGNLGPCADTR
jgi:hypothetical protein